MLKIYRHFIDFSPPTYPLFETIESRLPLIIGIKSSTHKNHPDDKLTDNKRFLKVDYDNNLTLPLLERNHLNKDDIILS